MSKVELRAQYLIVQIPGKVFWNPKLQNVIDGKITYGGWDYSGTKADFIKNPCPLVERKYFSGTPRRKVPVTECFNCMYNRWATDYYGKWHIICAAEPLHEKDFKLNDNFRAELQSAMDAFRLSESINKNELQFDERKRK